MDGGGEEGHKIPIHTGKIPVVGPAVDAVGQSLHGSEIITHKDAPYTNVNDRLPRQ